MIVKCEFCGIEIESQAVGTYVRTAGWSRRRSAGGANQISLPEREHRFACTPCIDLRSGRRSEIAGQTSLLGDE